MDGDTPLEERVLTFVARQTSVRRDKLSLASSLQGDLGIDGDDAWELMEAFAEAFRVDLAGFRFDRHFSPEGMPAGCNPLFWPFLPVVLAVAVLWRLVRGRWPDLNWVWDSYPSEPLTLRDLVDAASAGRWIKY